MLQWVLLLLKESGQILASLSFSGLSHRLCQKQCRLWGFPTALGATSVCVDSRLRCRGVLRGAAWWGGGARVILLGWWLCNFPCTLVKFLMCAVPESTGSECAWE